MLGNYIQFTWADAWLLMSILYSKKDDRTFDIADVVRTADVINHAMIMHSEIDEGIERLILGGYLSFDCNHLMLTDKSLQLNEKVNKRKLSMTKEFEYIEKLLKAIPYTKDYKINPTCSGKYISKQEYEKAIKSYLGKAKS